MALCFNTIAVIVWNCHCEAEEANPHERCIFPLSRPGLQGAEENQTGDERRLDAGKEVRLESWEIVG